MGNIFNKRSLKFASKRRKNSIIIGVIVVMAFGMFLTVYIGVNDQIKIQALAHQSNVQDVQFDQKDEEVQNRVSWMINIENQIKNMNEENTKKTNSAIKTAVDKINYENSKNIGVFQSQMKEMKKRLLQLQTENKRLKASDRARAESVEKKIKAQEQLIAQLTQQLENGDFTPPPLIIEGNSSKNSPVEDNSPPSNFFKPLKDVVNRGQKEVESYTHSTSITLSSVSFANTIPEVNKTKKAALSLKQLQEKTNFTLTLGFHEAYMLTGAYAPLFLGGSSRSTGSGATSSGSNAQFRQIPVVFELTGDMAMPNDTYGSMDSCWIIGTGTGNASSRSIDIRTSRFTCLFDDGHKQITGDLEGYVVGESSTPGIPAIMIYKAGEFISRVIASGILESLSQSLVNAAGRVAPNDNGSAIAPIYSSGFTGASNGISNVFSRLADFYLSLAEQTLPILEAKGGRYVTIMFVGGGQYKVHDINLLDANAISNFIDNFAEGEKI